MGLLTCKSLQVNHSPLNTWILTVAVVLLSTACKEQEDDALLVFKEPISVLRAHDVGNREDASDIRLEFILSPEATADDLRIYLTKSENAASLEVGKEDVLFLNHFLKVHAAPGKSYKEQLRIELLDIEGDSIRNGIEYQINIAMVTNDEQVEIANTRTHIKLTNVHPLEGQYKGVWNDNTDGSIPVSANLRHTNGFLFGPFFYTNVFDPCCGGADDGQVVMQITRANAIANFRFEQDLTTFTTEQGCPGSFFGGGQVQNFTRLFIRYNGNDCLGSHQGTLILDKQ